MLRGNSPATIDSKGRLKIPTAFRRFIEDKYGQNFFVTSVDGQGVRLYPFDIWLRFEKKLSSFPSFTPAVMRLQNLLNYYGAESSMDKQGRVLIQPLLRDSAQMNGEVAVLGKQNHLEVWNKKLFESQLKSQPLTEEDRTTLSSLGL